MAANRPTNAERLDDLTEKVDLILAQLANLTPPTPPPPTPPPLHNDQNRRPHMKLEVPCFDGTDAMGWIFKISQFFDYHNTPETERLTVASFYMDGPALTWYQYMYRNGHINSWFGLLQALEARFAPSYYDDPSQALFKLTQRGSLNQYLTEFERLANRIIGLPQPFILNCFISGLAPEIRREVQALQPATLSLATALAKLQEDKIDDRRRNFKTKQHTSSSSTTPPLLPTPLSSTTQPPNNPSRVQFRKLSSEDMASRREKGLCYNCDETFIPGHKCKGRLYLLVSDEPDPAESPPSQTPDLDHSIESPPDLEGQISFHSLAGSSATATLRIIGQIANHPVTILIDGGSTHNFIQTRVAKFLNLNTSPVNTLKVMVGNGHLLECHHLCNDVALTLQSHPFTVDFYVLPLSGADIILGAPWLKSLGPVIMDYSSLTLSFTYHDTPITLTADAPNNPTSISAHQLKRCIQTQSASELFHIQVITPTHTPTTTAQPPSPIHKLTRQYSHLFHPKPNLPPSRPTDHHIHLLPSSSLVSVRPYRYPFSQKNEIEHQVKELLHQQLIRPSQSPFSSPVLLVKKKDGSWRFCVDYRALNSITVRDRFPMPTIDELLDELGGASWFSKLDLRQGFHQIRMNEADIHKTAFRTHQGHYEYRVMPFGLCNAPSTFQATMNELLQPFLRSFVAIFFDDILVYSVNLQLHLFHLEQVFNKLLEGNFFLKESKCIQAMVNWPQPTSIKALRGFLGLTGFYRKFIKGYATLASPLTTLLRKNAFQWSTEAQSSFDKLKLAMTQAPTLALPDFSQPFDIETDASGCAMGAVLMQQSHPIAFFSQPFCPKLQRSSTYVRELHAITSAVKKWRQYPLGHRFTIFTDHKSLKDLLSQEIQTPEQHTYLSKLLGYDYTIQYKAGKHNIVADALSRTTEDPGTTEGPGTHLSFSIPHFLFLDHLRQSLLNNPTFSTLLSKIQTNPSSFPQYKIHNGLILYKNRIWLDCSSPFCAQLLEEFHSTPLGGHMGITKTLARLKANFFWEGMRESVTKFVSNCYTCQLIKTETKKPAGLLQPLPLPSAIWEDLSLDFITGLPMSHGFTVILVIVDRFSKGVHLGALPTKFIAYKVARLFIDLVCKHHGFPHSLVSDRDPVFISNFWRELFRLCGTKLRMSTAYHPETDGQTEVFNRILEQYLRSFVHKHPQQWFSYLHLAEWSHNTSLHSFTGFSPFEIIFGKPPPSIPHYLMGSSPIEAVDSILSNRQKLITKLKATLTKAQTRMKRFADQKRRDVSFDVNSWVYVKLRPYRQKTATSSSYTKLSQRYYGPFKVLARIGPVAYHLELPASSKIHPVFHCSLLKPHQGPLDTTTNSPILPPASVHNHPLISPLAIISSKWNTSTNPPYTNGACTMEWPQP
ncbi:hypothetical protein TSUD_317710 [Trifolium subterraneum]|uniref:Reverse transcriptase n=1 Tax=Trifolium subterraneum TaxID=3900 RepID=A0A2Z6M9P9_TRISU|nr:hypothetical protein TSUD_317710 [Trifolium subterraneum]